jgi:hypothetical protein
MCLQTRYNTIGQIRNPLFSTSFIKQIGKKWNNKWRIERYYPGLLPEFGLVYIPDDKLPKEQRRRKRVPAILPSEQQNGLAIAA